MAKPRHTCPDSCSAFPPGVVDTLCTCPASIPSHLVSVLSRLCHILLHADTNHMQRFHADMCCYSLHCRTRAAGQDAVRLHRVLETLTPPYGAAELEILPGGLQGFHQRRRATPAAGNVQELARGGRHGMGMRHCTGPLTVGLWQVIELCWGHHLTDQYMIRLMYIRALKACITFMYTYFAVAIIVSGLILCWALACFSRPRPSRFCQERSTASRRHHHGRLPACDRHNATSWQKPAPVH